MLDSIAASFNYLPPNKDAFRAQVAEVIGSAAADRAFVAPQAAKKPLSSANLPDELARLTDRLRTAMRVSGERVLEERLSGLEAEAHRVLSGRAHESYLVGLAVARSSYAYWQANGNRWLRKQPPGKTSCSPSDMDWAYVGWMDAAGAVIGVYGHYIRWVAYAATLSSLGWTIAGTMAGGSAFALAEEIYDHCVAQS